MYFPKLSVCGNSRSFKSLLKDASTIAEECYKDLVKAEPGSRATEDTVTSPRAKALGLRWFVLPFEVQPNPPPVFDLATLGAAPGTVMLLANFTAVAQCKPKQGKDNQVDDPFADLAESL